jgi:hypothetical protein
MFIQKKKKKPFTEKIKKSIPSAELISKYKMYA